jgi:hypothetical protein
VTEHAHVPDFAAISCGMRIAALLGLPLPVNGHAITVLEHADPAPAVASDGEGAEDMDYVPLDDLELARRCAFLMRLAVEEIERLGVELGHFEPPPPPELRRAVPLTALGSVGSSVLQPPVPEPIIVEKDGGIYVAGSHLVQKNGPAEEWTVTVLPSSLLSRHDTREDALAAAIEAAKAVWRPDMPRSPDVPPFTHQPGGS